MCNEMKYFKYKSKYKHMCPEGELITLYGQIFLHKNW